jgi:hypothetical protein
LRSRWATDFSARFFADLVFAMMLPLGVGPGAAGASRSC